MKNYRIYIEKTIEQVNSLFKFYGLKIGWKK